MITFETVETEAGKTNINPSEAQRNAGNYKKGHISVKGMKIAIENPAGSKRYYGNEGKYNVMKNHYGYFNVTKGRDGDAVDVFLGPDIENFDRIYCIDQNKEDGEFDETKVMLGFNSKEEAKEAYLSNYSPDWTGFRDITSVSVKDFKKWLYRGRKQRQPFADYVYIQKKKLDEMKKVIKLNESDITRMVRNAVKRIVNERIDEWGDDAADMMGMYDGGYDGPTNEPDVMDTIYDKAMRVIRRTGDFENDLNEVSDAVMEVMDELEAKNGFPAKMEDCVWLVAQKAVQKIDPVYYEEEFSQLMESRKRIKENKLTRDDDFKYPEKPDDEYLDSQYEKWKGEQPTQKDWDDFGFWASSDEPDLVNDEIGAAHDRAFPIDADDEGEGYSRDYFQGVEFAKNLIAKSKVPQGMVEELNQKEDDGTISAFELGILDTLDEG